MEVGLENIHCPALKCQTKFRVFMKVKVKVKSFSCVQLFVTPWTAAHQSPLPMGFSRQEYWSGVPLPTLSFFKGLRNEMI